MRILITGGAGFIGSHIAENLLNNGHDVIIVDSLIATRGSLKNIAHIINHEHLTFHHIDIRDEVLFKSVCYGVDYILHQAAMRSVPESWTKWHEFYDANINGTWSVFEAAKYAGVKAVVFASSSSVFGATQVYPQHENLPTQPLAPYPVSKDTNEKQAYAFARQYKVPIVALRYFNVFGERQSPESNYAAVIPKFIQCILKHKYVPIEWDGEQSRDFTYVDNVVLANLKAAEYAMNVLSKQEIPYAVFNIANGTPTSVNKIAESIGKALNLKYNTTKVQGRPGDMRRTCADPGKAEREMGYKGYVSFDAGIENTVDWFKKNPEFFIKEPENIHQKEKF